jgi:hypothetical protein
VSLDTTLQSADGEYAVAWVGPCARPPPPPPVPLPPPATPIGAYTSVKEQWIIHQNPPSYNDDKGFACTANQMFDGCAAAAACALHIVLCHLQALRGHSAWESFYKETMPYRYLRVGGKLPLPLNANAPDRNDATRH